MNKWNVEYTDIAMQDLIDIYNYISKVLLEDDIAKKISVNIYEQINDLNFMPKRNPLFDKNRNIRKLIVNNFSVFYTTNDDFEKVIVLRIMYSKRDIDLIMSE